MAKRDDLENAHRLRRSQGQTELFLSEDAISAFVRALQLRGNGGLSICSAFEAVQLPQEELGQLHLLQNSSVS